MGDFWEDTRLWLTCASVFFLRLWGSGLGIQGELLDALPGLTNVQTVWLFLIVHLGIKHPSTFLANPKVPQ